MARSCVEVGRQPGDVELVQRAPRAVDRRGEACPRSPTGRSPWPAADRTAAAALARDSRRRRPARPGPDGSGRRVSVPVPWATTRACTAKPRGVPTAFWSARPSAASESPAAMRNCASTRSMPSDLLGDRVLDLDARIALDEEVLAGLGVDQELDGAGVHVAARRARASTASARMRWRRPGVEVGRGRDLDDLLVAQLHRAVALEEVHDVALAVGQHLHLDVARPRHELLEEQRAVAERGLGLALAAREGLVHLLGPRHGAHAAAAAAGRRLQHHRIADRRAPRLGLGADAERRRRCRGRRECPATWASARASTLSPNSASAAGDGPMKRQALGRRSARRSAAFSDRKP